MLTIAQDISDGVIPIVAIGVGGMVGSVFIISHSIRRSIDRKQREESRRELAAYVAEGTMTPENAERLLRAGEEEEKD